MENIRGKFLAKLNVGGGGGGGWCRTNGGDFNVFVLVNRLYFQVTRCARGLYKEL